MNEKIAYNDLKCPECGYDRELEGETLTCQHCGYTEAIP